MFEDEEECQECYGSGKCQECDGDGAFYDSGPGGEEIEEECLNCNGSGSCEDCGGFVYYEAGI